MTSSKTINIKLDSRKYDLDEIERLDKEYHEEFNKNNFMPLSRRVYSSLSRWKDNRISEQQVIRDYYAYDKLYFVTYWPSERDKFKIWIKCECDDINYTIKPSIRK